MAENTKIEWTDATFNAWEGCTKVSAGCAHCYAETRAARFHTAQWGPHGTRRIASEPYWRQPERWNELAAAGKCLNCEGSGRAKALQCPACTGTGRLSDGRTRARVFCASLADVFEGPETMPAASHTPVAAARRRLFRLIGDTPHLDWLLLTKRPENILPLTRRAIAPDPDVCEPNGLDVCEFAELFPNVWLGTSVENQEAADARIPHLLNVPAAVRFLSCEPLLGEVDLREGLGLMACPGDVDWVIVGGESGNGARPFNVEWARSLRDQCAAAGVAFFCKQFGAVPYSKPRTCTARNS